MSFIRIICLIILFQGIAQSQEFEPESKFAQANELYRSHNFKEAISNYNNILEEGWVSFELYYNLSVSHHAIGEFDKAILYMQKAQLIDPSNELVGAKLEELRVAAGIDIIEVEEFLPIRYWKNISQSASSVGWLFLQVIFSLLTIVALWFWLYGDLNKSIKKKIAGLSILFLFFFVLCYSLGETVDNYRFNSAKGVVMVEGYLYSGADERSDEIRPLKAGVYVEVLDKIDNWVKVRLRNKEEGWVEESSVSLI